MIGRQHQKIWVRGDGVFCRLASREFLFSALPVGQTSSTPPLKVPCFVLRNSTSKLKGDMCDGFHSVSPSGSFRGW